MDVKKIGTVLFKALLISAAVTGAAAAALALIAWLFHFSDQAVGAGAIVINIAACLAGGLAAGKGMKEKKYLWGLLLGVLYFLILLAVSCAMAEPSAGGAAGYITTILICLGSGMLGGMLG